MTPSCSAGCGFPFVPVSDDPSGAHPGCSPADPVAFDAQTQRWVAAIAAGCAGRPGLCPACSKRCAITETSPEIASAGSTAEGTTSGREDGSGDLRARADRSGPDSTTDEPRRAA